MKTLKTGVALAFALIITTAALAKEPIKIGFSDWPGWVAWQIAKDKGMFEKQGVEVNLIWFTNYTDSVNALAAGKLDANCEAWSDVIQSVSEGAKLRVVLVNDNSAGNDAVVAKPEFNSIKDLKGKQVATEKGTVEHMLLLSALARNGMGENSVKYINLPVDAAAAAFLAGKVDAVAVWQPWIGQLEREAKGKVLFTSKEMPGLIPDQLVFQESVVSVRSEEIQKIVATWFDVVDFIKNHEDEAVAVMAKVDAAKPEDYKAFLPGTKFFDLSANLEAFQAGNSDKSLVGSGRKISSFLQAKEVIKTIPDIATILEPKFVNALKK